MAIFRLGPVIQKRREELGLTQEELADGICSVPTLSRIENGERFPSKVHLERLLQRLGYSSVPIDAAADKPDFDKHELRLRIYQAVVAENLPLARKQLAQFIALAVSPTQIDEQFALMYETILHADRYPAAAERLERYERALRITCPTYSIDKLPKVMTCDEILLLNNIAVCYHELDMRANAIAILYAIKDYYDHRVANSEEAPRTEPTILRNLSQFLVMEGRYDECIEVSDAGIRLARATGRCTQLGKTLFYRGKAFLYRNRCGDREAAEASIRQAYLFFDITESREDAEAIAEFYEEAFGKPIRT